MAQQVDVKGFGLVEFPDDISRDTMLDALRAKFSKINSGEMVSNGTAAPYSPTLAERAQSGISDALMKTGLISNQYRANRIGGNIGMALEAAPIIGDAIGGDDLGRAIREGDAGGIGFAALGAIPVVGDAARAGFKSAKELSGKYSDIGVSSFISDRPAEINLAKVVVPQESRSAGVGTQFMQDLARYADEQGKPLTLTPSADFGGDKKRLTEFYKRFGFVENKGKNKDYAISEAMYRLPQQPANLFSGVGGTVKLAEPESFTNQYGDNAKRISISINGKRLGEIDYIDSDDSLTIISSEISEQERGKGIGLQAYSKLIDSALSQGKTVKSDAIVSPSAQRIYEKLADMGYEIKKAEKTGVVRKGITTTTADSRNLQRSQSGTIYKDGVRTSAPFRVKGDPVFEVVGKKK